MSIDVAGLRERAAWELRDSDKFPPRVEADEQSFACGNVALLRHRAAMERRNGATVWADRLDSAANSLESFARALLDRVEASGTEGERRCDHPGCDGWHYDHEYGSRLRSRCPQANDSAAPEQARAQVGSEEEALNLTREQIGELRESCHLTYNGGHHEDDTRAAFHHGMDTVCNVLEGSLTRERAAPLPPEGTPPPAVRELLCMVCNLTYAPWFAPNELWNRVMRAPDGREASEKVPYICPTCFTLNADRQGVAALFEVRAALAAAPPAGGWQPIERHPAPEEGKHGSR